MSKSDSNKTSQPQMRLKLELLALEAGLLILGLSALILALALFSYNPADAGWNSLSQKTTSNLMGLAGAWLADVLFSLVGWIAWLLPLAILKTVFLLLRLVHAPQTWHSLVPTLKLIGLILLLVGLASLAAGTSLNTQLPYGAGGILGQSLTSLAYPFLGQIGANLLFFLSFLLGFTLYTSWTWLEIMDELGHQLLRAFNAILKFFNLPNSND